MLIAVDKIGGISSFDVIRRLRSYFPPKTKLGHAGTLDPLATGLMILGVTKEGTKRLHTVQKLTKSYITTIDFSQTSDTWDIDYRDTIHQYPCIQKDTQHLLIKDTETTIQAPSIQHIKDILDSRIPCTSLPLPPFSAKKVKGKKRYELARQGQQDIVFQDMYIDGYTILAYNFPLLSIELHVGSGTYIRSIAYHLGKQFSLGGILSSLRRTRIGTVHIDDIQERTTHRDLRFGEIHMQ